MFRISKQLEISRRIGQCETVEDLCEWLRVVLHQIGLQEARRFTSNTFLTFKSHFDNDYTDQLLESGPTSDHDENCTLHVQPDVKKNDTRCKLDSLPNAVFCHISFYLPITCCLHLSMTSHSFHKKTQNSQCLGATNRPYYNTIRLHPRQLNTIEENNCIMQCTHKYSTLKIKTIYDYPYSNSNCNNCPLSRLIDKIENDKNYDLLWFKMIWKNMTSIYVSNNYRCALEHIPISWILENEDEHEMLKPINVFGAINTSTTYISETIIDKFAKRMKNYINDNPDKKFRKIQRIWYDRDECDMIDIYSSFGNNITGIIIDLPRLWDDKCRFDNLETFFKVFHKNLNWLEIFIDEDNIGSGNIVSQLFKNNNNNKQLCDDLNKTEKQLSFNQFLKKYNCQNKKFSSIEELVINFEMYVPYSQCALFKLLNNDKIIKLLNIKESVKYLCLTSFPCVKQVIKHKLDIEKVIQLAISKVDNLVECTYALKAKNSIDEQEMQSILDMLNALLFGMVMKSTSKCLYLTINTKDWIRKKKLNDKIIIENKNQLSYCNRDSLKRKISAMVDNSIQTAKQLWRENSLIKFEQCFQIEREYSV